ncbi:MAG: PEGA domain-containing protein, partial [Myxococcota bacterium]
RRLQRRAEREEEQDRARENTEPSPPTARRTASPAPRPAARRLRPPPTERPDRATGQILVVTRPPGLTIYIDGEPKDITPAKITVKPGRHYVQIRLAQRELFRRSVRVASNAVEAVDVDLSAKFERVASIASATARPGVQRASIENDDRLDLVDLINPETKGTRTPVDGDGQLDLVKLIERDQPPSRDERLDAEGNLDLVGLIEGREDKSDSTPKDSASQASPGNEQGPAQQDAENTPRRIYVLAPSGVDAEGLRRGLRRHLNDVEVTLFSNESALKAKAAAMPPSAVLGPSALISSLGWSPRLRTAGAAESNSAVYLVSVGAPLERDKWSSATVGVVSVNSRTDAARYVQKSLQLPSAPKVRKVSKTDDLLPLLQFKMVDAVLVNAVRLPRLKNRTKLALSTQQVASSEEEGLAAGFSDAASRADIEQQLLGLNRSARDEMGTGKWVIR